MTEELHPPTLLEWIDAELEYHDLMTRSIAHHERPDPLFMEHNIAHLHLTTLRKLAIERQVST